MNVTVSVVRVFCNSKDHFGIPLGIVDESAVPISQRQHFVSQQPLASVVFVKIPKPGTNETSISLYSAKSQLNFSVHPTLGVAWWLTQRNCPVSLLHLAAGPVKIRQSASLSWIELMPDWTTPVSLYPMETVKMVKEANPHQFPSGEHYLWAYSDEIAGHVHARYFSSTARSTEEEANGSAAAQLTARLRHALLIQQGKGSEIHTIFHPNGWIEVGGRVAPSLPHTEHYDAL